MYFISKISRDLSNENFIPNYSCQIGFGLHVHVNWQLLVVKEMESLRFSFEIRQLTTLYKATTNNARSCVTTSSFRK